MPEAVDTVQADSTPSRPTRPDNELPEAEAWWRDRQQWLAERGYMLRPRYRPGWKPSWKAHPAKFPWHFEDWHVALVRFSFSCPCPTTNIATQSGYVLDAVRISDDSLVALKLVDSERNPHEVQISQYLSSEPLRSDPRNHSVPILDVLSVPNEPKLTIMVLPLLRACNDPSWQTVGEVLSFIHQILEVSWRSRVICLLPLILICKGLQYLHELRVAHRYVQCVLIAALVMTNDLETAQTPTSCSILTPCIPRCSILDPLRSLSTIEVRPSTQLERHAQ